MSTPEEYMRFVDHPIGVKRVTELPWIDSASAAELKKRGFRYVFQLLEQFLMLHQAELKFQEWLCGIVGTQNEKHITAIINELKQWCSEHGIRTCSSSSPQRSTPEGYGKKLVNVLPGIGDKDAAKLNDAADYIHAFQLLGQFLVFGQNKEKFEKWLKTVVAKQNNTKLVKRCGEALEQWCRNYDIQSSGTSPEHSLTEVGESTVSSTPHKAGEFEELKSSPLGSPEEGNEAPHEPDTESNGTQKPESMIGSLSMEQTGSMSTEAEEKQQTVEASTAEEENPSPDAVWRALYKIVDFEGIANAFLCLSESGPVDLDSGTPANVSPELPFHYQEEDRSGSMTPLQQLSGDAGESTQPDLSSDVETQDGKLRKVKQLPPPNFKVAQWSRQSSDNPVIEDYTDHTVIFLTSEIAEDEKYANLKSEILKRPGWFAISAEQKGSSEDAATSIGSTASTAETTVVPKPTAETTAVPESAAETIAAHEPTAKTTTSMPPAEGTSGESDRMIGSSLLTILIRKHEDVNIELILCMEYYQMVWMQVKGNFFVLINCDKSSIYKQVEGTPNTKQQDRADSHMKEVLTRLVNDLLGMNMNIVMSAPSLCIPDTVKEKPKADRFDGWNQMIANGANGARLAFRGKAKGEAGSPVPSFHFTLWERIQCSTGSETPKAVGQLNAVTWNVSGCNDFCDQARLDKLLAVVQSEHEGHIVYLQEFPPARVNTLSKIELKSYTKIFGWRRFGSKDPLTQQCVYIATLLADSLQIRVTDINLLEKILASRVEINGNKWTLLNCHLKAHSDTWNATERKNSFHLIHSLVKNCGDFLVGGDTNILPSEKSDEKLAERDAWVIANKMENRQENWITDNKYTWDAKENTHQKRNAEAKSLEQPTDEHQSRLDRFYFDSSAYALDDYKIIGKSLMMLKVSEQHLSDHYGVRIQLKPVNQKP